MVSDKIFVSVYSGINNDNREKIRIVRGLARAATDASVSKICLARREKPLYRSQKHWQQQQHAEKRQHKLKLLSELPILLS